MYGRDQPPPARSDVIALAIDAKPRPIGSKHAVSIQRGERASWSPIWRPVEQSWAESLSESTKKTYGGQCWPRLSAFA
jgi:hypothetical protein